MSLETLVKQSLGNAEEIASFLAMTIGDDLAPLPSILQEQHNGCFVTVIQ